MLDGVRDPWMIRLSCKYSSAEKSGLNILAASLNHMPGCMEGRPCSTATKGSIDACVSVIATGTP